MLVNLESNGHCKSMHAWHYHCSPRGTAILPIQIVLSRPANSLCIIQLRKIDGKMGIFGITNFLLPIKTTIIKTSSNHFYFHTKLQNRQCLSWSSVWCLYMQLQNTSYDYNCRQCLNSANKYQTKALGTTVQLKQTSIVLEVLWINI